MTWFRSPVERDNDAQAKYRDVFAAASKLFFEIDPVGINFESNADEYDLEVSAVLPRLESAESVADVRRILREEFVKWFSAPYEGERSDRLASELWALWQDQKSAPR